MESPKLNRVINIFVPATLHAALELIAKKERRSMKQQCVVVLEEYAQAETLKAKKAKYDELVAGGMDQFEAANAVRGPLT